MLGDIPHFRVTLLAGCNYEFGTLFRVHYETSILQNYFGIASSSSQIKKKIQDWAEIGSVELVETHLFFFGLKINLDFPFPSVLLQGEYLFLTQNEVGCKFFLFTIQAMSIIHNWILD